MKDSRDTDLTTYLVFCCVTAALPSFLLGYSTGVPNIPQDVVQHCSDGADPNTTPFPECLPMSDLLWGLANGLFSAGGLIGSLMAGPLSARFGRKSCILYNNVFLLAGSAAVGLAITPLQLILGRFTLGVGCGLATVVQSIYIGEVATTKRRAALGSLTEFGIVFGVLIAVIVTLFSSDAPYWRISFSGGGVLSLFCFFGMLFAVETPQYLLMKGHHSQAKQCLQYLRKGYDVSTDSLKQRVLTIVDLKRDDLTEKTHLLSNNSNALKSITAIGLLRDSQLRPLVFIAAFTLSAQILCGITALEVYSASIIRRYFSNGTAEYITCALAATNVLMGLLMAPVIDKFGRRRLLLISQTGVILSCVALVFILFVIFFAIGLGPIPWLIVSEMFPTNALDSATAIVIGANWLSNFGTEWVFPIVNSKLEDYTFVVFTGIGLLQLTVFYLLVPETKPQLVYKNNQTHFEHIQERDVQ
ncbi:hypothetical protein PROFUN_15863 [Planoprotostelium fungivorum]|uniref:Major facilitator superfamily (MFS) profile domain-containing protein n=1 Tax=Planoprotostelium fungivorum TaxID=1890364 RepID=A0A2P6MSM7_9EUKA|nr:hypothetical protein PROFUN_16151 [Planoprotostelium fungivorum]PRP75228.1 hypothetical protein PROFUN_15863 [Planoprotostelium fungivorum]